MAIDIEEHELVPQHEVLPDDEVEEVLAQYNASRSQLPEIKQSDAVVKQLEAEVGDVIRITRASPTADETVYYRVVVED